MRLAVTSLVVLFLVEVGAAQQPATFDVVVYGGTAGGVVDRGRRRGGWARRRS